MQVKDIMSRDVTVAVPHATLGGAAQMMRGGDFRYLPVGENDYILGAVTERDIIVRGLAEGLDGDDPVHRVMTENVIYCFENASLDATAALTERNQIRWLVVLGASKRLVGIISNGDTARATKDYALTGAIETSVAQVVQ